MSVNIQYNAKKLSSEAAAALLERGDMTELAEFPKGDSFELEKQIPLIAGKEGRSASLRLDQLSLDKSSETRFHSIYFLDLSECRSANCQRETKNARGRSEFLKAWKVLAPELSIVKVYVGDSNKDGYNDVLVQMSDGAGLLFNSRRMSPKKVPPPQYFWPQEVKPFQSSPPPNRKSDDFTW